MQVGFEIWKGVQGKPIIHFLVFGLQGCGVVFLIFKNRLEVEKGIYKSLGRGRRS